MTVTVVNPAKVVAVAPSAIVVLPIVTELFCNDELGTFASDIVFVPPSATVEDPVIPPEYVKLIDELVREPLPIFVSVFVEPLMLLLDNVSLVALPTSVSLNVGSVNVPVLLICEITGNVNVLLVNVWLALSVTTGLAPIVAAVMLNVPPVTVLPVNVNAFGNDKTTFVVPTTAISLGVPVIEITALPDNDPHKPEL